MMSFCLSVQIGLNKPLKEGSEPFSGIEWFPDMCDSIFILQK